MEIERDMPEIEAEKQEKKHMVKMMMGRDYDKYFEAEELNKQEVKNALYE